MRDQVHPMDLDENIVPILYRVVVQGHYSKNRER